MLHLEDGSKRFLVHEIGKEKEFARTDTKAENTVLASFGSIIFGVVTLSE